MLFLYSRPISNQKFLFNFGDSKKNLLLFNNFGLKVNCPLTPPNLKSRIKVNQTVFNASQINEILENENIYIESGGRWKPENCTSNNKVKN
jgi:uridylate kinase